MIEAAPYDPADEAAWDELVGSAPMATFLHSRRFLAYHGDRFEDASLTFRDGEKLVGLMPAALDPGAESRVVSHPGATFGGVIHDGALGGERMFEALGAARDALSSRGATALAYKAAPWIYQRIPSNDDLHALFRLGAQRTRVDLSCAIDLVNRRSPSARRKRGRKKAAEAGLVLSDSKELLPEYWRLLETSLEGRYGVRPVHSLEEIGSLADLFPDRVGFLFASLGGELVAGIVVFSSPQVVHVQYSASGDAGRETSALDALTESSIDAAKAAGRRFYDFGISTEAEGRELNEDLYRFKFEFGGGGVAHELYELAL